MIEEGWNWLVSELAARGRIEAAPAVIGDGATEKRKPPGPSAPPPEVQLKLWNEWLQAHSKGTLQTAYCETRNPPITPKTLRNYRDNLKREKMIE